MAKQWHCQMRTAAVGEGPQQGATRNGVAAIQIRRNRPLEIAGLIGGVMLWIAMWVGFSIYFLTENAGPVRALVS